MSQGEHRAQLKQAEAKYFEGLAKKDFNLIPYDDDVALSTPLAPGGIHKPLVGKENLRTVWWTPLPAILGEVRVFDFYYNDDLTAVVGEVEVEITNPRRGLELRIVLRLIALVRSLSKSITSIRVTYRVGPA
jgi:hypothetical protein